MSLDTTNDSIRAAPEFSILQRATRADIRLDPYPHVLIHDALPPAVFQALAESFPSL